MNFNDAYGACNDERVVYYRDKPHLITYTTAGGTVRPAEGIAHIRPLNDDTKTEVSVHEISLTKSYAE